MLAYFKSEMTLKCLKTLEHQGIEKLVLVDNSADQAENQRTLALAKHFPPDWLHIVIASGNLGFAKGINLALDQAKSLRSWDFFLILNNDIEAKPNLVKNLYSYIDTNPDIALLGAASETPDTQITPHLYYQKLTGLMFHQPVPGSFQVVSGSCLLIRPEVIQSTLFSPEYFMYGEDVELTARILQQGQKTHVISTPLLIHESAQSSGKGKLFYEYHVTRGHLLLAKDLGKNTYERIIMYALRAPLLLLRAILRSWRFKNPSPLNALAMCALKLPAPPSK